MTRKILTVAAVALLVVGAPLGLSGVACAKGTTHATHASASHGGSSHAAAGGHHAGGSGRSPAAGGGRSGGGGTGGGASGSNGADMARTILGMVGGLLGQR